MKNAIEKVVGTIPLLILAIWSIVCLQIAKPSIDSQSFLTKNKSEPAVIDFVRFYQTGAMCLSNERARLYDPDFQTEFTNQLISPNRISKIFIYYVPFMFPLMAPLATQPLTTAYTIFYATTLLFGVLAFIVLNNVFKYFSWGEFLIFILAVFSSGSSIVELRIGQIAWLMTGLLCFFFYALKRRWEIPGGIFLSLLSIKFQYLPLFIVAMIANRRWKLLIAAFFGEIALVSLSGFTIGWSNVFNYPKVLLQQTVSSPVYEPYSTEMVSLRGLLFKFLERKETFMINNFALLAAAVFVYRLWHLNRIGRVSQEWAISLTVVCVLLFSPHCFAYDLLLLSLPALLTLPSLNPQTLASLPNKALRVWSLVMFIYPLFTWFAFSSIQFWTCFVLNMILLVSGSICAFRSTEDSAQAADEGN